MLDKALGKASIVNSLIGLKEQPHTQSMNKSTLHKLILSRSLYQLAKENVQSTNGIRLSIACNILQDAVECFLLALSERVNAGVGQRTDFDKYFDQINLKIAPRELPFRLRLLALNKLRVNSKHYGLEPARAELDPLFTTVWEFFTEVARADFGEQFATLSLVDMLHESEAKKFLRQAELAFDAQDYVSCLVSCRQAVFTKFEWPYDAQPFLSDTKPLGLFMFGSKVPYYARDRKYLEEHVVDPTGYVIYDHNALEMDLMKSGVDSVAYWNVWRLTPDVYRENKDAPWIVKNDLRKTDADGVKERAEYVLWATTEMILAADQNTSRTRSPENRHFYLNLKYDSVSVYSKASKLSRTEKTTGVGVRKLHCDYSTGSLDGTGTFWHVVHWEDGVNIYGFVHEDDVDN